MKDQSKPINLKLTDVVFPIRGFCKYVKRNIQANTTNTNSYATGFYHLLVIHLAECIFMGDRAYRGIENILHSS